MDLNKNKNHNERLNGEIIMKKLFYFLFLIVLYIPLNARMLIVDINGSGQYRTISLALQAAVDSDTIKVLPGTYMEAITISKNIVLMGSGYESTIISSGNDPTITMSNGKIMWFMITSSSGCGIRVGLGTSNITNCIFSGCSKSGVSTPIQEIYSGQVSVSISNCIFYGNSEYGTYMFAWEPINMSVQNCISILDGKGGYMREPVWGNGKLSVSYSCGKITNSVSNVGNIDTDPGFNSPTDYRINNQSPCWDNGKVGIYDPDGSRSDIGYFGGPDAPIYPVVIQLKIVPQQGGGVQIQAVGRANY